MSLQGKAIRFHIGGKLSRFHVASLCVLVSALAVSGCAAEDTAAPDSSSKPANVAAAPVIESLAMVDIAAKFDLQPTEANERSEFVGYPDLIYVLPEVSVDSLVDLIGHIAVSTTSEYVTFHPEPTGDGCINNLTLRAGDEVERIEAIAETIVDVHSAGCWAVDRDTFWVEDLQDNLEQAVERAHRYSLALEPVVDVHFYGPDAGFAASANGSYQITNGAEWVNTPEVIAEAAGVLAEANGVPVPYFTYRVSGGCLELSTVSNMEIDNSGLRSVPNWNYC